MTYKTKISLDSLLCDLAEDRQLARELGQASAAIQATVMAAKLVGLMVDRKESGAPGDFASLTSDQILARVREDHGAQVADALAKAFAKPETESPSAELDELPAEPGAPLN